MVISSIDRQDVLSRYAREGFVVFRDVIDEGLVEEARAHVEWLSRRFPDLRPEHFHHPLMRDDAFWVRMVTDSRLLDIAELFVGPDIACFTAHYICKPPRDGHAVLWHQDGAYWELSAMSGVTLWLAVDRSGTDNGCLRMLPGSHRRPLLPIRRRTDVPNMLASSVAAEDIDVSGAVDVVLQPGDVSVHHPHIIHGSEPNTSPHRRCGLDIGYIPASVTISNEALYLDPMLVRGRAAPGCRYRPWPRVRPDDTVPFRGNDAWDEQVLQHNAGFEHIAGSNEDAFQMTLRMMRRLEQGTVKSQRAAGG